MTVMTTIIPLPSQISTSPCPCDVSQPLPKSGFAFARINGDVVLVQIPRAGLDSISSAFLPIEIAIFRHEFITIFRFSHNFLLHPSDILILERIDESSTLYEEDSGTVFLAKDVVEHLQNMTLAGMRKERRRASLPAAASGKWRNR